MKLTNSCLVYPMPYVGLVVKHTKGDCVNLEANLYTDLSFIISSLDDAASDDVIHPCGV